MKLCFFKTKILHFVFIFTALLSFCLVSYNSASANQNNNIEDIKPQTCKNLPNVNAPIEVGRYQIYPSGTLSRVIDIPGASKQGGTVLNIYESNGSKAQVFDLSVDEKGYYTIKNVNSNLVFDVYGGQAVAGTAVQQYTSNSTQAQKWIISAQGDGYYIKSAIGNYVLDVRGGVDANGTGLNIYNPNASEAQVWHFTKEGQDIQFAKTPIAAGSYIFSANAATSRAVDVAGGSILSGANVQIYEGNRTKAQNFKFSADAHGYYTIKNENSDKVLDVASGQTSNGANVQQYLSNNTLAQKWVIVKNSDGTFTIHNAAKKNLVLDIWCGQDVDGANIDVYEKNNTAAQKWTFYNPSPTPAPAGQRLIADGWNNIGVPNTNLVVDIPNGSRDAEKQPQLYTKNNSLAQQFYFKWESGSSQTGYYRIYAGCGEDIALSIKNASVLPGSSVFTKKASGDETYWALSASGNLFTITNKATGLSIALDSVTAKQGTLLVGKAQPSAKAFSIAPSEIFTEGVYTIGTAIATNKVMDVPNASKEKNLELQIYSSNDSFAQKWRAKRCAENTYAFQSLASGLWLGVNSSGVVVQKASSSSSVPSKDLYWKLDINKGYYTAIHVSTNKALELKNGSASSGNKIITKTYDGSTKQCWDIKGANIIGNGIYSIGSVKNSSKVVDINGGSFYDGAAAQMYGGNDSGAQAFVITNLGNDVVDIRSCRSKKYLDVCNGQAVSGTGIQQYSGNGSNAQHWKVELLDDCSFVIRSMLNNNLVLDSGACTDGTRLTIKTYSGASSQKFTFNGTSYPDVWWSGNCWYIDQNPELPWGCESVALTELLTGVGYFDGKTAIAANYIAYSDWDFVNCFAGSPWNPPSGIGCTMPPCIANAGSNFLANHGSRFRMNVATGTSLTDILWRANAGYPSIVWTTIDMCGVSKWGQVLWGYQTYSNEHAVCVVGYDPGSDSVFVCDSLAGKVARPRGWFESIYDQAGRYAVTID